MNSSYGKSKSRDLLMIFFIVLFTLVFRRPDAFTNPQLWAEDFPIFFLQFEEKGVMSLIIPYAGYLHFIPRLVAILWGELKVNYLHIPLFYNASAFIITYLLALNLWNTSFFLNIENKILYATCFLFLPLASDIFMTITNLNWITSLFLINFLFVRPVYNQIAYRYLNYFFIFIISLTGPFSTILSPIVILIIIIDWKDLSFKKLLPLLLILAGGLIQLICMKFIDPGFYRGQPGEPEHLHFIKLITNNIEELTMLKDNFFKFISPTGLMVMSFIIFLLFSFLFARAYLSIKNNNKHILLLVAVLCFGAYIKTYWPHESKVLALENARYYFIPYTCIAWLIILSIDKIIKTEHIIIYFLFMGLHYHRINMVLADKHWKTQIQDYYNGKNVPIEVNPDGWHFNIPQKRNER